MKRVVIILGVLLAFGIGFYFGNNSKQAIFKESTQNGAINDLDKGKNNSSELSDSLKLNENQQKDDNGHVSIDKQDMNQNSDSNEIQITIENNGNLNQNDVKSNIENEKKDKQEKENLPSDSNLDDKLDKDETPIVPVE